MRTVKEADVRKNEIVKAAAMLFAEKGFDNTSVTDIMSAVGIAKGTLYHHFKSKEEIMDALVKQQTSCVLSAARKAAADKSIPVKERLIRTIQTLHVETAQTEGAEMIQQLHKPQNALMHQKTKQILFQSVPQIMSGIIEDGIAQGIFATPYPLECMEIALCYLDSMLDDNIFELEEEQRPDKIRAFVFSIERLLGAKAGGLACLNQVFLGEESKI